MGRYPAYYLMGREPLFVRIAPLTPAPCDAVVLCGISIRFRMLSPSQRQVVHALLTRSPLGYIQHTVLDVTDSSSQIPVPRTAHAELFWYLVSGV